ncbi:hypothetical protein V5N11_006432 [Cardamine amara subsp. amara]|uniref:TFIIA n=1 Tax=Cardamine amara subsp. amara TaxID=228776 RepID=A0ABD1BKJ9_CARAN
MVLSSEASTNHIYVIDDVISKSRSELVYNGELEESVLNQIQSIWKTKMIQAGLISATIETSSRLPTTLQTPDPNPLPENAQFMRLNPSMDLVMPIKRERDGFYIPQQDGARDEVTEPNTYDLNDENDEELLNEDDDDDEEDAIDDDMDIPHLVMCQFDKVKRSKNKWECNLKSGVMQINGKNIHFSKATGVFNF